MSLAPSIIIYIVASIAGYIWVLSDRHQSVDALDFVIVVLTLPLTLVILILSIIIYLISLIFQR